MSALSDRPGGGQRSKVKGQIMLFTFFFFGKVFLQCFHEVVFLDELLGVFLAQFQRK